MKKIVATSLILLCLSLFVCTKSKPVNTTPVNKYANRVPKILVVHSYSVTNPWTMSIDAGIKDAFAGKGYQIETFSMNISSSMSENDMVRAGILAREKLDSLKPDMVIATDDEAQRYFAKDLTRNPDIDVIFCGVENDPSIYNYPVANVTGILERPHIQKTIQLLNTAIPGIQSYTLLTDKSTKSNLIIKYIKGMNLGLNITINEVESFDEWKEVVNNINTDAFIILNYREITGTTPDELLKWTVDNLKVPSIAFEDTPIKAGIMFGKVESGYEQGKLTGDSANLIIGGRKPIQIVVSVGREGLTLVNNATAKKFNADLSQIRLDGQY